MRVPLLSDSEQERTARQIAAAQAPSGLIPRVPQGSADPWNHVEAAIALDLSGMHVAACRAYEWLAANQAPDGSWRASYDAFGIEEAAHIDTNTVGYLATGLLVHVLVCPDDDRAPVLFDCVDRALELVLRYERSSGAVPWSINPNSRPSRASLRAATSSLVSSLMHGSQLARLLGHPRDRWAAASRRIADGLVDGSHRFLDKSEFAMDWYYPVLTGALDGGVARERFLAGRARFVTEDGVRCRSDRRWVTTAESAEAAIAAARIGEIALAATLLSTTRDKRADDGTYLTGLVYPERSEFPTGERSVYSSAAVIIANDALAGGVMSGLFGIAEDGALRGTRPRDVNPDAVLQVADRG